MDFNDSPEEAEFRGQCRDWLDAHAPRKNQPNDIHGQHLSAEQRVRAGRQWQSEKAAAGYGAITWPRQFGGLGGTPMQEVIYRQEEAHFNVPAGVFNISLGMVLPSLMHHASPDMLQQHVRPALYGDTLWCQLLSEPGAGSDLGMIRTRAKRCTDGREGWIINGQKVWTSLAQHADYGLILTRTNPDVPKFKGMTVFYLPMDAAGIEIRPIRQANGESDFNEVFFNDVFVPDAQRVGAIDGGWRVTLTGLMSERLSIGGVMPADLWRVAHDMLVTHQFDGARALADGRMRQHLSDLYLQSQGLWLLQCRGLTALSQGREPGPELSAAKITTARTLQDFAYFAMDLKGAQGVLAAEEQPDDWEMVERMWFGAAGMRIAGGTDEIIKNSIGERVLGLPGQPRTDKGVPFKQLR